MRAGGLLDRVGLGEAGVDFRFAWRVLLAVCALYAVSFAAFYPKVVTNDDEDAYVRHAQIVLQGRYSVERLDALTGEMTDDVVSRYPIGTSLMMAPFVALAGWRGAFLVPLLSLIGTTLLTGRWLQREGRSPIWALLVLGYPTALLMGRVGMSDIPSMAIVSLGIWLFWQGIDRGWRWWLAAGVVAGASTIWREPNALIFVPFFAGAVLRRERSWWALAAGGMAGLTLRLLASTVVFGRPFFYKAGLIIDLPGILDRLPTYLTMVMVMWPGGLLIVHFYRGRRWPELIGSVNLLLLFYVIQGFWMAGVSLPRQVILMSRYLFPLLPLMALAAAEVLPRFWRWLRRRAPAERRPLLETLATGLLTLWIGGVAVAAVVVHPVHTRWCSSMVQIRDAIAAHTDPDAVLVTHIELARKFIDYSHRKYLPTPRDGMTLEDAMRIAERVGSFKIAFLDRTDGKYGIDQAALNEEFLRRIEPMKPVLEFDRRFSPIERLRIWRVGPPATP